MHKPGWKTSEFWLILTVIAVVIIAALIIRHVTVDQVIAGILSILGALGYGVQRTIAKTKTGPVAALIGESEKLMSNIVGDIVTDVIEIVPLVIAAKQQQQQGQDNSATCGQIADKINGIVRPYEVKALQEGIEKLPNM